MKLTFIDEKLRALVGTRVTSIDKSDAGVSLFFDSGAILAVYSPVRAIGVDLNDDDFKKDQLRGHLIENVVASLSKVMIVLDGGIQLEIDLDDGSMTGPEHFQFISESGDVTVWR